MSRSSAVASPGLSERVPSLGVRQPQLVRASMMFNGAEPLLVRVNRWCNTGPPRTWPRSATAGSLTNCAACPGTAIRVSARIAFMTAAFTGDALAEQVQIDAPGTLPATVLAALTIAH